VTRWRLAAAGFAALMALLLSAGWWDRAADLRMAHRCRHPRPQAVERGAYLAQLGHCAGCHTARGGADYAGGRVIQTPFGSAVTANLTPDPAHGLGRWSEAAFRRALRDGRSADGRALLPACPVPELQPGRATVTPMTCSPICAACRRSRSPVSAHDLRGLYGLPAALTAWRWLHVEPAALPAAPAGARADWRRGAYLVGGLGHCSACHGQRDAQGATAGAWDFRGGPMPLQGWLAPSLADPLQAAVSAWTEREVVALLKDGRNDRATVSGPMALVVHIR
jgi:mono/diheme cytochrome c family protein